MTDGDDIKGSDVNAQAGAGAGIARAVDADANSGLTSTRPKSTLRRKIAASSQTSLSTATPVVTPFVPKAAGGSSVDAAPLAPPASAEPTKAAEPQAASVQGSSSGEPVRAKVEPTVVSDSDGAPAGPVAAQSADAADDKPDAPNSSVLVPDAPSPIGTSAAAPSLARRVGRPRKDAAPAQSVSAATVASKLAARSAAKALPVKPATVTAATGKIAPAKAAPARSIAGRPVSVPPVTAKAALNVATSDPVAAEPAAPAAAKAVSVKTPVSVTASAEPLPASPASPAKPVSQPALLPVFSIKDMTMDVSANFSGFQDAISEAQAKAQAAFEKSSNALGEVSEFAKGNVEAVIESSKIFAEGLQDISSTLVAEGRTAFEAITGDIKELAAAKSPTDFLKIQSDIARKNFDSAVAYGSKNSEAMLKLLSDAVAPISGRVSLGVEKARQQQTAGLTPAI